MVRWLFSISCALGLVPLLAADSASAFREDFSVWSNAKAGEKNTAGWIAAAGDQNYQAAKDGARAILDASGNGDQQSAYQGWRWAVRKELGLKTPGTHVRLEYDFKNIMYIGPSVWLGRSDDNQTTGYGVVFSRDGNTGQATVDLLKFAGADYAAAGGMGEVIGLVKGVKLQDWDAYEGKKCTLQAWNHVELCFDAESPADPVTRLTLYLNGDPQPLLSIADTRETLNPTAFTHVNFAAKGLGNHKVYLAALTVTVHAESKPRPELAYDMESFLQAIKPFKHSLDGRFPLLLWNIPLTDGILKDKLLRDQALQALKARGIVPTLGGTTWRGNLVLGQALQERHMPVHLQLYDIPGGEAALYANAPRAARGPDATLGNKEREWPCLNQGDPKPTADVLRRLMRDYQKAGIRLDGVWFDYEALPHPWNGAYASQRDAPECRKFYPAGVLDSFRAFQEYIYEYRSKLFSEAMVDPVREVFPKALVSNYSEFASGKEFLWNDWPPRTLARLSAMMPMAYATTNLIAGEFKDKPVTQDAADLLYFRALLRTVSDSNANKQPGQLSLPYMSRYCAENPDPKYQFGMSSAWYRELIRHLLLRGTDGFYLFNEGYPGGMVTARQSFDSVEDVRSAYDELLAQRPFLDLGVPLTYVSPKPKELGVVWSGLRLKKQCLVRVFPLERKAATLELSFFPGQPPVSLAVPPDGATYLIAQNGDVKKLGAN